MTRNKDGNDEDSIWLLQIKLFCRFSVFMRFLCKDEIGLKRQWMKMVKFFFSNVENIFLRILLIIAIGSHPMVVMKIQYTVCGSN